MLVVTATTSTPRTGSVPRAVAAAAPSRFSAATGSRRNVSLASPVRPSSGAGYQTSRTRPSAVRVARPEPVAPAGVEEVSVASVTADTVPAAGDPHGQIGRAHV